MTAFPWGKENDTGLHLKWKIKIRQKKKKKSRSPFFARVLLQHNLRHRSTTLAAESLQGIWVFSRVCQLSNPARLKSKMSGAETSCNLQPSHWPIYPCITKLNQIWAVMNNGHEAIEERSMKEKRDEGETEEVGTLWLFTEDRGWFARALPGCHFARVH